MRVAETQSLQGSCYLSHDFSGSSNLFIYLLQSFHLFWRAVDTFSQGFVGFLYRRDGWRHAHYRVNAME